MANAIELAKSYVPLLDEVYAREVLTSDLDGAPELVQQGANANELIIPMMDMQGLADYSRNSGYVQGDVTLGKRDGSSATSTAAVCSGSIPWTTWRLLASPSAAWRRSSSARRSARRSTLSGLRPTAPRKGIGKKEETLADGRGCRCRAARRHHRHGRG